MAQADHDPHADVYHPKDALGAAMKAIMITGGAGLFISTIQTSLTKQNVGAMSVFTRTGGTIGLFAATGGAYEFVKCASANLREKDDTWNTTWGGFASGAMIGLRFRSVSAILGYGSGLAIVLSAFTFTGGRLSGHARDPAVDEVSRKEYLRKNRRKNMDETIHELGEGRGIYGPGYEERRAQRIKENYGIDVPVQSRT